MEIPEDQIVESDADKEFIDDDGGCGCERNVKAAVDACAVPMLRRLVAHCTQLACQHRNCMPMLDPYWYVVASMGFASLV